MSSPAPAPPKSAAESAAYLASLDCVHCGLCVQQCPTYLMTGRESANPRGRIYLMRALLEGRTEPTPGLVADLDLCLVCRACESICPSGVQFGEVMADARSRLRKPGRIRRWMMSLLGRKAALHRFAGLIRLTQVTKVDQLARLLPARVRRLAAFSPRIPPKSERLPLPSFTPAEGTARGRVAVFEGCVMSVVFADVNRDTVRLLSAAGYDVVVPSEATCCGALHEHDGDLASAHSLLGQNSTAYSDPSLLAIVHNSSGCGAAFAGAGRSLGTDLGQALTTRSQDLTRFLLDHGQALRFRSVDLVVTYDAPCHLHHAVRETTAPLELLARVPGLKMVPMEEASLCCGAAGIYNLDQPEMSRSILARKLDHLAATGAEVLVTGNPGCILQWRSGIAERKMAVDVLHPATLLARLLA